MAGSSLNLIDLAKSHLTGDFKDKLSSLLGESRDRTQSGLNAAVPGIFSGLDGAASTPDGANRLASAVDGADTGILSNISSMFGRGSLSGMGSNPLQSVLGGGALSELTGNIGRASGLPGKGVSTMLGFLAPVLFGALKKLKQSRGLDASGLSNLLAGQRSNIAAAMPEGMREFIPETHAAETAAPHARMTDTYSNEVPYSSPAVEHHKSSLPWIVPLAILAGVLGLIWWGASRSRVHAGRDESGLAEQTARERANVEHVPSFVALKSKYQSVFDVANAQGVQISKLTSENGKLILQGTAPSLSAANKVWDQVKRVNPQMNDIVPDIKVQSSQAQPMTSEGQQQALATQGSPSTSQEQPAASEDQSASSEQQPAESQQQAAASEQQPTTSGSESMPSGSEGTLNREKPSAPEASGETGSHTYIVKPGDTLSKISKHFYGNARDYKRILDANSSTVTQPDVIAVGQKLQIPSK